MARFWDEGYRRVKKVGSGKRKGKKVRSGKNKKKKNLRNEHPCVTNLTYVITIELFILKGVVNTE